MEETQRRCPTIMMKRVRDHWIFLYLLFLVLGIRVETYASATGKEYTLLVEEGKTSTFRSHSPQRTLQSVAEDNPIVKYWLDKNGLKTMSYTPAEIQEELQELVGDEKRFTLTARIKFNIPSAQVKEFRRYLLGEMKK